MPEPTLTLCMIVRDVERVIEECLVSAAPFVDEIIIVDTGSTDRTRQTILRAIHGKRNAVIYEFSPRTHPDSFVLDTEENWKPLDIPGPYSGKQMLADFGAARQFGWQKASGDYLMWLDSDDVLVGGEHIRFVLEEMSRERIAVAMVDYDYAEDGRGNVTCKIQRERIVRRGAGVWKLPIHECIATMGPRKHFTGLKVKHRRDKLEIKTDVHHRNLKLLTRWWDKERYEESPDPRLLFYLACEERWHAPERAIEHFRQYCQRSGWDEERARARYLAGSLHENAFRYEDALAEFAQGALDFPHSPDCHFGAARIAYYRQNWNKVIEWTEKGLAVMRAKDALTRETIMRDIAERSYRPHVYYSAALVHHKRWQDVIDICNEGLRYAPDEPHLKGNKEFAEKNLVNLAGKTSGETSGEASDQNVPRLAISSNPHGLDIVIWTGPAWEVWTPDNIDAVGIGGSETAAACMARELARLGHRVRVLSECRHSLRHEDVEYIPYQDGLRDPGKYACDIFVCSRQIWALETPFQFRACILWVHDVHVGEQNSKIGELLLKADRYFCLSNWHKGFFLEAYPFLHPDSVIVTRNGIDVKRFAASPVKSGHDIIYSSSPDRGLERLLELLPQIRAEVPEVKLHVYYGFENWKKALKDSPSSNKERVRVSTLEAAIDGEVKKGNLVFHGRVGQQELARGFLGAKLWTYPTWFWETYGISALEAQAAGCVPVTTKLAALGETVKHGVLLPPHCTSPEYGKSFVHHVVRLLRDDQVREQMARAGRSWAMTQGWNKVALDWTNHFERILAEKAENPLPMFGQF